MINLFVSYCQKDSVYAENIDLYFQHKNINIHRDIRDISNWKSIREYMNTIRDMDYAVLIITDNYLKSFNCMYEVLEVIKEKNYEMRIFPVVVETSIYSASGRIPYIKYWEEKFEKLQKQISEISIVNAGSLIDDLRRTQNICLSIEEFLSKVADMNNPSIVDVNIAIENKLNEYSLLNEKKAPKYSGNNSGDIFSSLNIPKTNRISELTDLEKNKFMSDSYKEINALLEKICSQLEQENCNVNVQIEQIDTRTCLYEFYKNGGLVRTLKVFLGNCLGSRENTIGLSCDNYSYGSNSSFNGIISHKIEEGKIGLYFSIGISMSKGCKTVEEVVKDIWVCYIQQYL